MNIKPLLTLVFFVFVSNAAWSNTTTHDVIVVGAGAAGLAAAQAIKENNSNYNVLVIEASDRIGGRIHTATLGDTRVDLGAEEHYDPSNNPVRQGIQAEFGNIFTGIYRNWQDAVYSMSAGNNTCSGNACYSGSTGAYFEQFDVFYDWVYQIREHTNPSSTLADDMADGFDGSSVGVGHPAFHLYENGFAGGTYSTSLDQIGARSQAIQSNLWDLSETTSGINDRELGYGDVMAGTWWNTLVHEITTINQFEVLPQQVPVLLGRPVTEIQRNHVVDGRNFVRVRVGQGPQATWHAAWKVIITVSVGVLKEGHIKFTPALPTETIQAYSGIGIDKGMKVAMEFSEAWWLDSGINNNMDWLVTEGVAGACWFPTGYKESGESHILMCYPMGKNAKQLAELAETVGGGSIGESEIVNAVLSDVEAALNVSSKPLQDSIVRDWGNDPYFEGVYSFPTIDTFPTNNSPDESNLRFQLQEAVNDQLYFAGEATSVTNSATVVGAYQEGRRVASQHIIGMLEAGNPPDLPAPPPPPPGGWQALSVDSFESNPFGNWSKSGRNITWYRGSKASDGQRAIRFKHRGQSAMLTSQAFDLRNASNLRVLFDFSPVRVKENDKFTLQISSNGGASYTTIRRWNTKKDGLVNGRIYTDNKVRVNSDMVPFTDKMVLRFRSLASDNASGFVMDNVRVHGK